VKKPGNGVERDAAKSWRVWFAGRMLVGGAGLWVSQELFNAYFSWKPTTLTENKVNQNPLVYFRFLIHN